MKIINLILNIILLTTTIVNAEEKVISTPLGQIYYENHQLIYMKPLTEGLYVSCAEFNNFINQQGIELEANDFNFFRLTPLPKQMRSAFHAEFVFETGKLTHPRNSVQKITIGEPLFTIKDPAVRIYLESLQKIEAHFNSSPDALSQLTSKFKLEFAPVSFYKGYYGPTLVVKNREVACDLLSGKTSLKGMANYGITMETTDGIGIDYFFKKLQLKTNEVLKLNESDFVKAAMLGYHYSEILQTEGYEKELIAKKVAYLLSVLFEPNSLKLNSIWGKISVIPNIQYSDIYETGLEPVVFKLKQDNVK